MAERTARFFTIGGQVQGVGFRPFVHRLAHRHGIRGWVRNVNGAVEIHAEGQPAPLQRFAEDLVKAAPPLARPGLLTVSDCAPEQHQGFAILDSEPASAAALNDASPGIADAWPIQLPADGFVCPDCLAELDDPANRRHRYPFVNCTQCGPRYTLITALPYDRSNTAMRGFDLCPDCRREYEDPLDRRFHAEPVACPACGPHLAFAPSPLSPAPLPLGERGSDEDPPGFADGGFAPPSGGSPRSTGIKGGEEGTPCAAGRGTALAPRSPAHLPRGERGSGDEHSGSADGLAPPPCGGRGWGEGEFVAAETAATQEPTFSPRGRGHSAGDESALAATVAALRAGKIVAVKGVGGYHLLCDATNDATVATLRARKPRPAKPLAVMFPDLDALRGTVHVPPDAEALLASPERPIVLLKKRASAGLSGEIAPGLAEIGCLLPYSPLHALLLADFGAPLVATSGNLSGEPVLTDNQEAATRLARIADAFLHHDRPIVRPADDPLYRVIAGAPRPLRLGRGSAPLELELPAPLAEPVLALGSHMKNTLCLAWGSRAVVSPHIGELGTARSLDTLAQVAADLQRLYQVQAKRLIVDRHPGFGYRCFARDSGLPLHEVWHHRAHASALAWEFPKIEEWIVFAWDGVGLGEDGSLWGGEAFTGAPGRWRHAASFRPFRLPGGDKAGREPWRAAAALLWEAGQDARFAPEPLHQAWVARLNSPATSSVGRLFDAAAALTGVCTHASFEGEGPMRLEALAEAGAGEALGLPLARDALAVWRSDWAPLLPMLADASRPAAARAASFHRSMAQALVDQAEQLRAQTGIERVGLTGGVFQNRLLVEEAIRGLEAAGFKAHLPRRVPVNDAGLSFGQLIELLSTTA